MLKDAKWICCQKEIETPCVIRRFNRRGAVSARIAVTGLGFFELSLNGKKVCSDFFVPAQSDYICRRLDRLIYPISGSFRHRIYYLEYDITEYMVPGENFLEILLGNGWFRQTKRIAEGELSFGDSLMCIYEIELAFQDGSREFIRSDGNETCVASYITECNLFLGEVHDMRLCEAPCRKEIPVRTADAFDSEKIELTRQTCPPDRVTESIVPRLISDNGCSKIYDAGENLSGAVGLFMDGAPGDKATVRFAEELDGDGKLDFSSSGGGYVCSDGRRQIQTDVFISDGKPHRFFPKFVWHAFRFFEITSDAPVSCITVEKIHCDIAVTSGFDSDSEALNWLYDAYLRTQLCNMHAGVPSDCPHRERLGYTGDGQLTSLAAMMLTDSRSFYEKWITDINDCQDPQSGHVRHTAPFMGGGGGPAAWGGAVVIVPYNHMRMYADKSTAEKCYPHMEKWVEYMLSRSENGLVVREEEGGWCLGDWAFPDGCSMPEAYFNTCYFVIALNRMEEIASFLGKDTDIPRLREIAAEALRAVRQNFYDEKTADFCSGVGGANALAVEAGIPEDNRTLDRLYSKYSLATGLDTGFFTTDILLGVLIEHGFGDLAYRLISSDAPGSYLWMKRRGATTIYEFPDGGGSHFHPAFGAPARHIFSGFAGIRQASGKEGYAYKSISIHPVFPEGLNRLSASISTESGVISVKWEKQGTSAQLEIDIPENSDAVFSYNGTELSLNKGLNKLQINL